MINYCSNKLKVKIDVFFPNIIKTFRMLITFYFTPLWIIKIYMYMCIMNQYSLVCRYIKYIVDSCNHVQHSCQIIIIIIIIIIDNNNNNKNNNTHNNFDIICISLKMNNCIHVDWIQCTYYESALYSRYIPMQLVSCTMDKALRHRSMEMLGLIMTSVPHFFYKCISKCSANIF